MISKELEQITSELESDKILLEKIEEESYTASIVRQDELNKRQLKVEGRIEGLNIALKILT